MKSVLLTPVLLGLLAWCVQDGGSETAKAKVKDSSRGHDQHVFTVAFKRYEDGALLVSELYPELKAEPLAKSKSVRISGEHDTVEAAGALLSELGLLKPDSTWALVTNTAGRKMSTKIATSRLARQFPKLKAHYSESSNQILVYGDRLGVNAIVEDQRYAERRAGLLARGWQEKRVWLDGVLPSAVRTEFLKAFPDTDVRAWDMSETIDVIVPKESAKQVDEWFRTRFKTRDTDRFDWNPPRARWPLGVLPVTPNRPQIETMVRKEFDARQKVHAAELELLKQKLKELETRIQTHERLRDQMISKRVESLLADPTLAKQPPKTPVAPKPKATGPYKVQAGDTLGVFIPYVLGQEGEKPPIHNDPTGVRAPAMGYPLEVREDGTIRLPIINAQKVAGLTLRGIEAKLLHELTVKQEILKKDQATVLVSLIKSVDDVPPVLGGSSKRPVAAGTKPTRRASGKIQPGDTLGLVIENVLGNVDESPPIHTDPTGVRPPVMGYPVQVREDGTINLPLIGQIKVAGQSVGSAENQLKEEFISREILVEGKGVIMVSMIREAPATSRDPAAPEPPMAPNTFARSGNETSLVQIFKTPSEFVDKFVELEELARSKSGNERRKGVARLKALEAEYALQLGLMQSALKAQVATMESAELTAKQTRQMFELGDAALPEMQAEQSKLMRSKAAVEQLSQLLDAYKAIRPEKKSSAVSSNEANTPSKP